MKSDELMVNISKNAHDVIVTSEVIKKCGPHEVEV